MAFTYSLGSGGAGIRNRQGNITKWSPKLKTATVPNTGLNSKWGEWIKTLGARWQRPQNETLPNWEYFSQTSESKSALPEWAENMIKGIAAGTEKGGAWGEYQTALQELKNNPQYIDELAGLQRTQGIRESSEPIQQAIRGAFTSAAGRGTTGSSMQQRQTSEIARRANQENVRALNAINQWAATEKLKNKYAVLEGNKEYANLIAGLLGQTRVQTQSSRNPKTPTEMGLGWSPV